MSGRAFAGDEGKFPFRRFLSESIHCFLNLNPASSMCPVVAKEKAAVFDFRRVGAEVVEAAVERVIAVNVDRVKVLVRECDSSVNAVALDGSSKRVRLHSLFHQTFVLHMLVIVLIIGVDGSVDAIAFRFLPDVD